MSSPAARQRRRREEYKAPRPRREIAIAVAVAVGIIAATAIMIWMLRPGGIADRQPRASWLFGLALFAALIASFVVLRRDSRVKRNRVMVLALSLGTIALVVVVVSIFWPDGLLRHTPKPIEPPPTSPTAPVATTPTTPSTPTSAGTSTSSGATSSTAPTSSTGATTTSTIP